MGGGGLALTLLAEETLPHTACPPPSLPRERSWPALAVGEVSEIIKFLQVLWEGTGDGERREQGFCSGQGPYRGADPRSQSSEEDILQAGLALKAGDGAELRAFLPRVCLEKKGAA